MKSHLKNASEIGHIIKKKSEITEKHFSLYNIKINAA